MESKMESKMKDKIERIPKSINTLSYPPIQSIQTKPPKQPNSYPIHSIQIPVIPSLTHPKPIPSPSQAHPKPIQSPSPSPRSKSVEIEVDIEVKSSQVKSSQVFSKSSLDAKPRLFPDGPGSARRVVSSGGTRQALGGFVSLTAPPRPKPYGNHAEATHMKWDRVKCRGCRCRGYRGFRSVSSECKLVIGTKARVIRITRDLAPELEIEEDLVDVESESGKASEISRHQRGLATTAPEALLIDGGEWRKMKEQIEKVRLRR
ncbi:hypothetical protein V8F33_012482 [Rhypophila sp. PSN 637]